MKDRKYSTVLVFSACIFAAALLGGCGAGNKFNNAEKLEKNKYYVQAAVQYKAIGEKYPDSRYVPEALYRAARIYQEELKIYPEARKLYAELIYKFPDDSAVVGRAKIGIFDSPDYFPLREGYITVEGDSETGGRNMRVEQYYSVISTNVCSVEKRYYAGSRLASSIKKIYAKVNYELRELPAPDSERYAVILSFPFDNMKSWKTSKDNRNLSMTIVDNDATVEVRSGRFTGCLKVREEDPQLPEACRYEYYAPGVGHVLTTTGSKSSRSEHANTEIISYKFR
jgi:tetratricopeptide (TPR) repeat protein